jgi:hypothetical protein
MVVVVGRCTARTLQKLIGVNHLLLHFLGCPLKSVLMLLQGNSQELLDFPLTCFFRIHPPKLLGRTPTSMALLLEELRTMQSTHNNLLKIILKHLVC